MELGGDDERCWQEEERERKGLGTESWVGAGGMRAGEEGSRLAPGRGTSNKAKGKECEREGERAGALGELGELEVPRCVGRTGVRPRQA